MDGFCFHIVIRKIVCKDLRNSSISLKLGEKWQILNCTINDNNSMGIFIHKLDSFHFRIRSNLEQDEQIPFIITVLL